MANPRLPDINTIIAAGFNPKTGLPLKWGNCGSELESGIKKILRVIDEQNAVRRYKWYNLPDSLDGELIERILYYRGQLAFFYMEANNTFYALPYALSDTIDVYGRYTGVTPLPFNGSAEADKDKEKPWIQGLQLKPVYGIKYDELKPSDITESCVLLHDYAKQISQTTIPRQALNDPLLGVMAECVPFMRTSMLLGTGVKGMRVNDASQEDSVQIAAKSMEASAKMGIPWIPIAGNIEFQELTDAANLKGADYMQAMQSLDNLRLSTYGLENGGLFEKKAHELQQEAAINGGNVGLVYTDGLEIRQAFCNRVNSIWGLGIWCEPSEAVMGGDMNGDGVGYDVDESNAGDQEDGGTENGNEENV